MPLFRKGKKPPTHLAPELLSPSQGTSMAGWLGDQSRRLLSPSCNIKEENSQQQQGWEMLCYYNVPEGQQKWVL